MTCNVEPTLGSKLRVHGSECPDVVFTVVSIDEHHHGLYTLETASVGISPRMTVDREWFRRRGIPVDD